MGENVGAGFGVFCSQVEIGTGCDKLPELSTVFQAELTAVKKSGEFLATLNLTQKSIKFHIDSQATLLALNKRHITSKLVMETVEILNKLAMSNSIVLVWVKAHNGNAGNELADTLAKRGAALNKPTVQVRIPRKEVRNLVNSELRKEWNSQWTIYPDARQSKLFLPNCLEPIKPKIYKKTREQIGLLVRCISGHNNLAYHQHRMHNEINKMCRFCDTRAETFYHLFTKCPRLKWLRLNKTHVIIMYFLQAYVNDVNAMT